MDMLKERCKALHLGKLSRARSFKPKGSTLQQFKLRSQSLGVRKLMGDQSASRRNKFLKFWHMVKIWHSFERMMGHGVDTNDCCLEFVDVVQTERERELLEAVQKVRPLTPRSRGGWRRCKDGLTSLQGV